MSSSTFAGMSSATRISSDDSAAVPIVSGSDPKPEAEDGCVLLHGGAARAVRALDADIERGAVTRQLETDAAAYREFGDARAAGGKRKRAVTDADANDHPVRENTRTGRLDPAAE